MDFQKKFLPRKKKQEETFLQNSLFVFLRVQNYISVFVPSASISFVKEEKKTAA